MSSPQLARQLGVSAAAHSDANRVALVIAVCRLAAGAFVTIAAIRLVSAGVVTEELVACLLGAVCALTLATMASLGANINMVGNTLLAVGCAFMAFANFVAGNSEIFGAAFIWYLTVPVVATFLFGMRHGTVWTIIVAAQIVFFLVLLEADLYRTAAAASVRTRFLAVVAALGFIHLVMSYFERSRSASHQLLEDRVEELEELAAELRESRDQANAASEAKSQFLATVSHEIRTPLNGVIGMAGVLGTTKLNDEQDRFVATIETSGNELLRIIDDILDLSRIEDGRITMADREFSLVECVEDALEQLAVQASRKGLELGYIIDPDVPDTYLGDRSRLQQVLINLISNAVKFTPTGTVLVSVDSQPDFEGDTALLSFRVTDTGIGIPASAFQRLFEPFSQVDGSATRKYGGTGLGLVIAKELITRMGGTIRVESIEGRGSTFTFTATVGLVADALGAGRQEADGPGSATPLKGEQVLVVYRSELSGDLMTSHIRRLGGDPVAVGFERMSNGTIDAANFFAVMTDDVTLATRLSRQHCPVVLVGAAHDDHAVSTGQGTSTGGLITRPIRTRRLRNLLLELTAEPTPQTDEFPDGETEGAEIEVQSREGEPASTATSEPTSHDASEASGSLPEPAGELAPVNIPSDAVGPPRILVAEDNKMNQTVLDRIIQAIGLEATVVSNGAEAVEATRREHFDIVFMDLRMPVLGGIEATRLIREESIDRPYIIAVTANTTLRSPTDYVPLGIDDYLMKPVRPHQLAAAVDTYYKRTAHRTEQRSAPQTGNEPVAAYG